MWYDLVPRDIMKTKAKTVYNPRLGKYVPVKKVMKQKVAKPTAKPKRRKTGPAMPAFLRKVVDEEFVKTYAEPVHAPVLIEDALTEAEKLLKKRQDTYRVRAGRYTDSIDAFRTAVSHWQRIDSWCPGECLCDRPEIAWAAHRDANLAQAMMNLARTQLYSE